MPRRRRRAIVRFTPHQIRRRTIQSQETDEQRQLRLRNERTARAEARARQTDEQRALQRQRNAEQMARARARETPDQRARRRRCDRISSAARRQRRRMNIDLNRVAFAYDRNADYHLHPTVTIGAMDEVCRHCNALKYRHEASGMCCSDGKVALPHFNLPPDPLLSLVKGNNEHRNHFYSCIPTSNIFSRSTRR